MMSNIQSIQSESGARTQQADSKHNSFRVGYVPKLFSVVLHYQIPARLPWGRTCLIYMDVEAQVDVLCSKGKVTTTTASSAFINDTSTFATPDGHSYEGSDFLPKSHSIISAKPYERSLGIRYNNLCFVFFGENRTRVIGFNFVSANLANPLIRIPGNHRKSLRGLKHGSRQIQSMISTTNRLPQRYTYQQASRATEVV